MKAGQWRDKWLKFFFQKKILFLLLLSELNILRTVISHCPHVKRFVMKGNFHVNTIVDI